MAQVAEERGEASPGAPGGAAEPDEPVLAVLQCCKCRSIVGDTSALSSVHAELGLLCLTSASPGLACGAVSSRVGTPSGPPPRPLTSSPLSGATDVEVDATAQPRTSLSGPDAYRRATAP